MNHLEQLKSALPHIKTDLGREAVQELIDIGEVIGTEKLHHMMRRRWVALTELATEIRKEGRKPEKSTSVAMVVACAILTLWDNHLEDIDLDKPLAVVVNSVVEFLGIWETTISPV